jgi:DNA repair protein RAD16
VTVWGDLQALEKPNLKAVVSQPADVKVKLLPFQLEGLSWLQQQETSRFHGGLLGASPSFLSHWILI